MVIMNTSTATQKTPGLRFEELNWVATTPLPRDQEQSHRLHEPDHLIGTIDPITGHDIGDVKGHPSLIDGNLTIYFESEETRQAFLEMPVNHPFEHSLGKQSEDIDRGG
jgi:YHS domain-containing protein